MQWDMLSAHHEEVDEDFVAANIEEEAEGNANTAHNEGVKSNADHNLSANSVWQTSASCRELSQEWLERAASRFGSLTR